MKITHCLSRTLTAVNSSNYECFIYEGCSQGKSSAIIHRLFYVTGSMSPI